MTFVGNLTSTLRILCDSDLVHWRHSKDSDLEVHGAPQFDGNEPAVGDQTIREDFDLDVGVTHPLEAECLGVLLQPEQS